MLLALLGAGLVAFRFTPFGDIFAVSRLQALLAGLRQAWWAPLAHVAICIVVGSLGMPATPILVAGAAIFGAVWGTLWNWTGIVLASMAGFFLARLLGRDFVERIGGEKVKRAERLLHRRGLWPLMATRFLPIPFSLVNAAAAVVGVRFGRFILASALGMLPPIAILTYFSAALLAAASGDRAAIVRQMLTVSMVAALLVFLPIGIRRRMRRRRLKRLSGRRAGRSSPQPRLP